MTEPPSSDRSPTSTSQAGDRLHSWKEIAAHLKRDVTTVQRWEKRERMPVHRHLHDKLGSVYAFRSELDAWTRSRSPGQQAEPPVPAEPLEPVAPDPPPASPATARPASGGVRTGFIAAAVAAVVAVGLAVWRIEQTPEAAATSLGDARFSQLSDFGGTEQAAAISRDGRFVAFLSDQDGQMDVWMTQVGTGRFYNLTRGAVPALTTNPSVRTLGFSPDGSLVTFWTRRVDDEGQASTSVWSAPILGGPATPYLEGAAELDWSADGRRLVYHTSAAGDPMFVTDAPGAPSGPPIFSAAAGEHSHFVVWSPDGAFIYFVQGTLPDRMDLWRIRPAGGPPERVTHHESLVSHPVFLDARTLVYLAGDADGSGPWLHSLDLDERIPRRTPVGIDRYTSLAASADGRRLVATRASSQGSLWRVPIGAAPASSTGARRLPLTTGNGSSPRLGADDLLYVASNGTGDSIWRLRDRVPAQVWSAAGARVVGGPALARGGDRFAVTIQQDGGASLVVANADGSGARSVLSGVELRGAPGWSADGRSIAIAVVDEGLPRVYHVPVDGGAPAAFLREYSVDPAWAPDGGLMVFSGPDIGTTLSIRAATPDAATSSLRDLRLPRGARRVVFMPGRRALVVLRGGIAHKNLWLVDLDTGAERQLTDFASDFVVRDFDVSADGRELVVERVDQRSDVVLLDLAPVR